MLKSILLAGTFLVTSNFLPVTPVGVGNVTASTITHTITLALPVSGIQGAVQLAKATNTIVKQDKQLFNDDASADGLQPEEREFVERINMERTSRGLNALALDQSLVDVARGHCREMCDLDYFDHHSPTPGIDTPMDRYLKYVRDNNQEMPHYLLIGENIYYCSVSNDTYNVAYGHQALMASPGHRANILDPRFERVGVGTYRDANGQFWVTEMFLKDRE